MTNKIQARNRDARMAKLLDADRSKTDYIHELQRENARLVKELESLQQSLRDAVAELSPCQLCGDSHVLTCDVWKAHQ